MSCWTAWRPLTGCLGNRASSARWRAARRVESTVHNTKAMQHLVRWYACDNGLPYQHAAAPVVPFQRCALLSFQAELFFVVVDSHIQRIVLTTEETTVIKQVSHRPIKCQFRLWPQRGTKVNGSHHGDNPHQTQTNRDPNRDKKLCDSTSNDTDQCQSFSSNLLTPYREQPRSTRKIAVAYPRPAFSATEHKLRSDHF